ncbi:unnamed protein product [Gadus morhua 'NCC']
MTRMTRPSRPAAMLIERSSDFGRSWRPYRYFAYNCTKTFPAVIYKVLDPAIHVKDPYSLEIQELLRNHHLRINLNQAAHAGGQPAGPPARRACRSTTTPLYELVVRGSCFCYGHASECPPCPAWTPGSTACQCHFDMAVFLATGNVSGGVCDGCLHNTMGRSCDLCEPFYYRDPRRDVRDPQGGVCDGHSDLDAGMIAGQCRCKANVKGTRCDDCKEGYYGLSQEDPLGCQPCNCDPRGIIRVGAPCDQISGDCSCKRYVTGRHCDQCLAEHWGLSNDLAGCRSCDCDFGGAFNNRCMVENGQCDCRRHLIGRQCSEVQPGYFCAPLDFSKYEAEGSDVTGHAPDDSTLPGKARPRRRWTAWSISTTSCSATAGHRRMATAKQQRAALRRIRQLQQTPDVLEVHRVRSPGHMITWTGPGFRRVKDGAGLVFTVDDVPHAMEYDIMIRYEPESTEDWEVIVSVTSEMLASSHRCGNLLPTEQLYTVSLPHRKSSTLQPPPYALH